MKLREIIENLDKSEDNFFRYSFDLWDLQSLDCDELYNIIILLLNDDSDLTEKFDNWISPLVKQYWITKWYDSDSHIGMWATFYKDELLCITSQYGRKSDETSRFTEVFSKFYDDCLNKAWEIKPSKNEYDLDLDLDVDIQEFPLQFAHALLDNKLLIDGELKSVRRLTRAQSDEILNNAHNFYNIMVEDEVFSIEHKDVRIPFCLNEEKFNEVYKGKK